MLANDVSKWQMMLKWLNGGCSVHVNYLILLSDGCKLSCLWTFQLKIE